jgi:hypothetical protein
LTACCVNNLRHSPAVPRAVRARVRACVRAPFAFAGAVTAARGSVSPHKSFDVAPCVARLRLRRVVLLLSVRAAYFPLVFCSLSVGVRRTHPRPCEPFVVIIHSKIVTLVAGHGAAVSSSSPELLVVSSPVQTSSVVTAVVVMSGACWSSAVDRGRTGIDEIW